MLLLYPHSTELHCLCWKKLWKVHTIPGVLGKTTLYLSSRPPPLKLWLLELGGGSSHADMLDKISSFQDSMSLLKLVKNGVSVVHASYKVYTNPSLKQGQSQLIMCKNQLITYRNNLNHLKKPKITIFLRNSYCPFSNGADHIDLYSSTSHPLPTYFLEFNSKILNL